MVDDAHVVVDRSSSSVVGHTVTCLFYVVGHEVTCFTFIVLLAGAWPTNFLLVVPSQPCLTPL